MTKSSVKMDEAQIKRRKKQFAIYLYTLEIII